MQVANFHPPVSTLKNQITKHASLENIVWAVLQPLPFGIPIFVLKISMAINFNAVLLLGIINIIAGLKKLVLRAHFFKIPVR